VPNTERQARLSRHRSLDRRVVGIQGSVEITVRQSASGDGPSTVSNPTSKTYPVKIEVDGRVLRGKDTISSRRFAPFETSDFLLHKNVRFIESMESTKTASGSPSPHLLILQYNVRQLYWHGTQLLHVPTLSVLRIPSGISQRSITTCLSETLHGRAVTQHRSHGTYLEYERARKEREKQLRLIHSSQLDGARPSRACVVPSPVRDDLVNRLCDADVGVLLAEEVVLGAAANEGEVAWEVEAQAGDEEREEDVRHDDCGTHRSASEACCGDDGRVHACTHGAGASPRAGASRARTSSRTRGASAR
jgi:hypothetical protein